MQNQMRSKKEESLNTEKDAFDPELFRQYAIEDENPEFEKALQNSKQIPKDGVISVKSSKKEKEHGKHRESDKSGNRRGREEHGSASKSKKKRKSSH